MSSPSGILYLRTVRTTFLASLTKFSHMGCNFAFTKYFGKNSSASLSIFSMQIIRARELDIGLFWLLCTRYTQMSKSIYPIICTLNLSQ